MAISTYTQFKQLIANARQKISKNKLNFTVSAGRHYSLWTITPNPGTLGSGGSAITCSNNLTGSIGQQNSTFPQYLVQVETAIQNDGYLIIADRLCQQSGLSGTTNGSVTTNLPTAPLPRYTDGEGVFMCAEIYASIGATAALISASYTNELGVANRKSLPTVIGSTAFQSTPRMIILPLAEGDKGVISVESVWASGSTGTAGNYGITLFKPLVGMPLPNIGQLYTYNSILSMCGNFPLIQSGACLYFQVIGNNTTPGVSLINLTFVEDQS